MKTAIIQLESHDDMISIRDKIMWSKAQRVILVFPQKLKQIPHILDLRLMQRSAKITGASLALVTRNRWIVENAEAAGIPVFISIPKAEKGRWGIGAGSSGGIGHPRGIEQILNQRDEIDELDKTKPVNPIMRLAALIMALSALMIMGVFTIPSAEVTILPVITTQEFTVDITAASNVNEINITGLIPAKEKTFELKMEKSAVSTGSTSLPKSKATGVCLVENSTVDELILPAGVVFSTGGEAPVRFVTKEEVKLLPGSSPEAVQVEALLPGEDGNITSGQISLTEGIYAPSIVVTNPEAFTGGSSMIVPSPTKEDYTRLRSDMMEELTSRALEDLKNPSNENEVAIIQSLKLDKILSEVSSIPAGEPSDSLSLTLKVQFRVLTYDARDVHELVNRIVQSTTKDDAHTLDAVPSIMSIGNENLIDEDTYKWQVKVNQRIAENWDQKNARKLLSGKPVEEAMEILTGEYTNIQMAKIKSTPGFWKRMPFLAERIKFVEVTKP